MADSFLVSMQLLFTQLFSDIALYIPKIIAALLVLLIGTAIARTVKSISIRIFKGLQFSKAIAKTPVAEFLKNADVSHTIEEVLGMVVYWFVQLIVVYTVVEILGVRSLSLLLQGLFGYLPHIITAVLVLFFGILLAGVVESVVKGSIKSIDGRRSRLFGKIAGYLVMVVTVLAAVSELGIATNFIIILFIGLVATVTLGLGLALGLGGQHIVREMLEKWYSSTKEEFKSDSE